MRKRLFMLAFAALLIPTIPVNAQEVDVDEAVVIEIAEAQDDTVSPCADILEWRYKIENYKVYKRLYNRSTGEWVGDWILCE